ncbi:MAG: hypothetical protein ILP08_04765 [Lachnospiraceae bacterium]|nr:hypothetical protein [Lachnospiraceae bacterium]
MTKEELAKVNSELPTVNIKGKEYVMVKDRVAAFRKICPNGSIETEIISNASGAIIMKATVRDGDVILATGTAWEKEDNGYINKTSYVENCETSCIGRALGFAGIGVDDSMASAEEVANAMINQNKEAKKISEQDVEAIREACAKGNVSEKAILAKYRVNSLSDITVDVYTRGDKSLKKWVENENARKDD